MIRARALAENSRGTAANTAAVTVPPATPCSRRNAISCSRPPATAHSSELPTKASAPPTRNGRRPYWSASLPTTGTLTVLLSR